jgi:hypothetical protein
MVFMLIPLGFGGPTRHPQDIDNPTAGLFWEHRKEPVRRRDFPVGDPENARPAASRQGL